MMMIQITVFSSASASAFWILCLLCSIGHAVPTESPSSDLFDTSQSGFSSLDQTSLDFWNGGDLQFQSNNDDFADGFPGTSASAIEPGSSDLFDDTTTTTFSAVGNDPYLASYMNGDATNFQEGGITQIAMDASSSSSSSSCELGGARDSESSVDVDLDVDKISRRDHRDFGDIIDFGRHGCPLGKEAACCSSGRPERVQNSMRMRPECRTWGEIFFSFFLSFVRRP